MVIAGPVLANPEEGRVAAGSASIRYGGVTQITQTSSRAVINWKNFAIDKNETTRFVTPNSTSVTLNRVIGGSPSLIMGRLSSNGQVFLVNPNGIVFGKTARVDVAGLIASTANITNKDFMHGNYHFSDAPAGSSIINEGTITVRHAGLAALVAPSVSNSGTIQAKLGQIVLASGSAFTLDLYGDNLISFDATSMVDHGLVQNLGRIAANGGQVVLSVASADRLVENVINTAGYISATSVGKQDGKIILQGYENSNIHIAGTLDVSGNTANETGGTIQVSGTHIALLNGSFLNATGTLGGGRVHIGGGYQGTGTLAHASTVNMDAGAAINASALQSGNGGNIILWSDDHTEAHGTLIAQGGNVEGHGGLIETSSANTLDVNDLIVNTIALHGSDGLWLLDPININVDDTLAATLTTNLASSSITLKNPSGTGSGDITFNNATTPVTLSNDHAFTVQASNDLIFNVSNAIEATGVLGSPLSGNITLTAGNDISFNAPAAISTNYYAGTIGVIAGQNVIFGAASSSFGVAPIQNNSGSSYHGQPVYIRSDNNATGTGDIIDNTGGLVLVNSFSSIFLFYSPPNFATPHSYNLNSGDGSPTGAYMLVFNNVSGHTLSDVASIVNTGLNPFPQLALAENVSGLTTPIGTNTNPFGGTLVGGSYNGSIHYYSISQVNINEPSSDNVGLIGYASGGSLVSVTLLNSTITGRNNVGSLLGYGTSAFYIQNSFSNATVTGTNQVGGLIGTLADAASSLVAGMYSGTITASGSNVGGLVGSNYGAIFTSLAVPTFIGGSNVGGVIGYNDAGSSLYAAYASSQFFSGPAIASGTTSGTAPYASMLSAYSLTTLPSGFNNGTYGSFWQTNGNGNYVSLITCSSLGCIVSTGSSTPDLGAYAKQYVTVENILNNNTPRVIHEIPYVVDDALMYSIPLATGDGIYVLTVTPESSTDTTVSADNALHALRNDYGCATGAH